MKRWERYKAVNTPEFHDAVWSDADKHPGYDAGRPQELVRRMKPGDWVCDLGCGLWGVGQWLSEKSPLPSRIVAVDFSPVVVRWLTDRCAHDMRFEVYVSRAENTCLKANEFDIVVAGELIEHFEEPRLLLDEMVRLCRPFGWITLSTVDPRCDDAIRGGLVYPDHVWEFEPDDLVRLLSRYGTPRYWRFGNYHMVECQVACKGWEQS